MAFGISRNELREWKRAIDTGHIAFLTHYWLDDRFPNVNSVTKVGCQDMEQLALWGEQFGLKAEWVHYREDGYSHFDLLGDYQRRIFSELQKTVELGVIIYLHSAGVQTPAE